MKKTIYYTYLGTNGTISSVVYLPDIYSVKEYVLKADKNKKLTCDGKNFVTSVRVSQTEVDNW